MTEQQWAGFIYDLGSGRCRILSAVGHLPKDALSAFFGTPLGFSRYIPVLGKLSYNAFIGVFFFQCGRIRRGSRYLTFLFLAGKLFIGGKLTRLSRSNSACALTPSFNPT
jgi:hypothetical protein